MNDKELKLKQLRETLILEDEKSLLIGDKLNEIKEDVGNIPDEIKDATQGILEAIQGIPQPDIKDYTEDLEEIKTKIQEPVNVKVKLRVI